ncbi:asparagine synthase B [Winogradskyella sp. UBA3174]|mgnify:FL=1|uniref:asparagine synthase B n=1 Tax=Winogradskyella sp. UBA3174 TaxID=1947785 RepID=UPI0025E94DF0|nr:asparagine synthase B [Winogradskyella sp. UBA3174]|tara:strand:+ start:1747 stop:3408 length:1662 start_codon:yes stop_codon:yes gene_type:complete
MCGIVCAFDIKQKIDDLRPQVLEMAKKIRHRGPDWSGIYSDDKVIMAHERLAIVDPASGKQPLFSSDKKLILAANGEIYNHKELRSQFPDYDFQTESDCEVILALYKEKGHNFLDDMNGIFGFAIYDVEKDEYFIARDHMGIIPLYIGWDKHGTFYVASELKALEGICTKIELFPPGHYMSSKDGEFVKWYKRDWTDYDAVKENETSIAEVKQALEDAVYRQLMSDVPYGVLLSGGLDSSVISAIAKKYSKRRIEADNKEKAWWPQLHSFSVGLEGSPDLAAAKKVADHIGTVHHEIKFTIQEGLDAIKDVIYNIETYDITTIRSSTPMYLMARVIKSMGIKMVLSGEGADEIFGGYLYFHKAPNAREFHEETVRKLDKLHMYDCLRANKSLAAWGIEGRVPFLDKEFIDVAMRINPQDKMINGERMEKWVVRKAFEDMIPESVAWRQKEQFSDGVGYSWIDTLKELVEKEVTDEQMTNAKFRYPIQTPINKEEYYYRTIFEGHFPSDAAALSVPQEPSVACSTKIALEWDEAFKNMNDPSGRAIANIHDEAY